MLTSLLKLNNARLDVKEACAKYLQRKTYAGKGSQMKTDRLHCKEKNTSAISLVKAEKHYARF